MPTYDDPEQRNRNTAGTQTVGDDFERASEGIPIFGDLSGANDKMAELRRERAQGKALDYLRNPALEDPAGLQIAGGSYAGAARPSARAKRAQAAALQRLQSMGRPQMGGAERGALHQQAMAEASGLSQARQQAAARGQTTGLGGGAQLRAGMEAIGNVGASRAGAYGDIGRDASARALDALSSSGELASSMRRSQFDETLQGVGERDAMTQYNQGYLGDVNERNAARRIRGKEAEVGVITGIADEAAAKAAADAAAEDDMALGLLGLI